MAYVTPAAAADGGTEVWEALHDAGGVVGQPPSTPCPASVPWGVTCRVPNATAASPDGTKVFVAGSVDGVFGEGRNYATVAYNVSTGAQLWLATFTSTVNGAPVNYEDVANAVAVSPDGTKVYVTGKSRGAFVTIAYNASTGAQLWARSYAANGPATAITVSPDGSTVFITGDGTNTTGGKPFDYATVAYNALTGAQLWSATFNGTANLNEYARAITVTPDGSQVIMTGYSETVYDQGVVPSDSEYVTIAYQAATGAQQWVNHFDPGPSLDQASSMAMSPDGSFVAVTGTTGGFNTTKPQSGTVAYDTVTGAQRWVAQYSNPQSTSDTAAGVAVAPDATKVYVTGTTSSSSNSDYDTVAFTADTGTPVWASTYDGPPHSFDNGAALAVSGDGTKVVVTGTSYGGVSTSYDYATVAYDTTTGAQQWVNRQNFVAPTSSDVARAITIAPGNNTVIVTGARTAVPTTPNPDTEFATIAIRP